MCIFCLSRADSFTEEGLNVHYWRSCPMLMRCTHCKQVVEIASLSQHLLGKQSDICPRKTDLKLWQTLHQKFSYLLSHHHNEHNKCLGLKTCSFKAQGVLGLSIFVTVFPYPAVPEVGTGKPASVGGFYPFVPGGLTISFDTILYLLLCRSTEISPNFCSSHFTNFLTD
jgi:hypothetical protein